jgi:Cytochrome c7 and related cytochrome c
VRSRILTIVLAVGLAFSLVLLASRLTAFHLPGNNQGYEPVQPIAYSHRLHAGELQIQCQYCHFGADKSRHAGIPPASVCMNCHKFVTAPLGAVRAEDDLAEKEKRAPRPVVSAELRKLYDAVNGAQPIAWTRIHSLPDFAYFDHRPHVNAGVACQQCHGPVESMERVRQVSDLSMGWCVNCHRDANRTGIAGRPVNPSINCSTCHF